MPRYGPMYGPDVTFLGVDRCAIDEPALSGLAWKRTGSERDPARPLLDPR